MKISAILAAAALALGSLPSSAAPVTWTLDLEFEDNGTAIGSFVWESDTNTISTWDIAVSAGTFTGNNNVPGDTFSNTETGHFTQSLTFGGYSFIQFATEDVSYFPGPDRSRFLRLGLGFGGLDVLDTPVSVLPLVPDTANQFPFTITGVVDCGSCSPIRNGESGASISAMAPVPLPASLAFMLMAVAALGAIGARNRFVQSRSCAT